MEFADRLQGSSDISITYEPPRGGIRHYPRAAYWEYLILIVVYSNSTSILSTEGEKLLNNQMPMHEKADHGNK